MKQKVFNETSRIGSIHSVLNKLINDGYSIHQVVILDTEQSPLVKQLIIICNEPRPQ